MEKCMILLATIFIFKMQVLDMAILEEIFPFKTFLNFGYLFGLCSLDISRGQFEITLINLSRILVIEKLRCSAHELVSFLTHACCRGIISAYVWLALHVSTSFYLLLSNSQHLRLNSIRSLLRCLVRHHLTLR